MCVWARTKGCTVMKKSVCTTGTRIVALAIAATVLAGAAPALNAIDAANAAPAAFKSGLAPDAATPAKVAVAAEGAVATTAMTTVSVKAQAALPVKAAAVTAKTTTAPNGTTAPTKRVAASGDELSQAKAILAGLIAKHPILQGTTVSFGDARGYQAIALYKSGRIVISPTHTASLERILNHEIWHIIDWRDNGRIDWGEQVPPK